MLFGSPSLLRLSLRVVCLEGLIVIEVVSGAVQRVGAGPDDDVGRTAGVAADLRRSRGHEREALDGIDGHKDSRNSIDTALVDGGNVPPQVVVVSAFNLPVYRVGAGAVYRSETGSAILVIAGETGGQP